MTVIRQSSIISISTLTVPMRCTIAACSGRSWTASITTQVPRVDDGHQAPIAGLHLRWLQGENKSAEHTAFRPCKRLPGQAGSEGERFKPRRHADGVD